MVKDIADARVAAILRDAVHALEEEEHRPGLLKKLVMTVGASAALAFLAMALTRAVVARRKRLHPERSIRPADVTSIPYRSRDYPERGERLWSLADV